jgi:hypothetical protein
MFETRKSLSTRFADAVDLMIDFATLGEYGLEPVEEPRRCGERRQRSAAGSGVGFAAVDRPDHLAARL